MRAVRSTEGRDTAVPAGETDRKAAAIAAMGYRLAAAGPRTRQRLLDRETATRDREPALSVAPIPVEVAEDRLPALSAWDDAAWERRISGEPEPALARLSVERTGFPVWRATALLASAACGFSLVLWGQSLHLDRKLKPSMAHDTKPVVVAGAAQDAAVPAAAPPAPPAPPVDAPLAVPALATPVTQVAGNAAPAGVPDVAGQQPSIPAAPGAALEASGVTQAQPQPDAPPAAPVPETAAAPVREAAVQPALVKPARRAAPQAAERAHATAAWASAATMHALPHHAAGGRMVVAEADAKPAVPKPRGATRAAAAHYDLPHWLTDNRPERAAPLIMSPPPHNLEPPPGAEIAAARPPPVRAAQATLPPIPQPARRPPVIYAEAHYSPPAPAHPYYNSTPYYGGYPQTYGYYGAMPPPTPYGEP